MRFFILLFQFFLIILTVISIGVLWLHTRSFPSIEQVYLDIQQSPSAAAAAVTSSTSYNHHQPLLATFKNVTLTNNITLNVLEGGEQNPKLVILLHGFPETALLTWGSMIDDFVTDGYHVIAPDMRGYNTSSKPATEASYDIKILAQDIQLLVRQYAKKKTAYIVSHDWGSLVSWKIAELYPDMVEKLVVSVPHPEIMFTQAKHFPKQFLKSWYILYFQLRGIVEHNLARNNYSVLFHLLEFNELAKRGLISKAQADQYVDAWSKPGAMKSMLSYYRRLLTNTLVDTSGPFKKITVPTLIVHGSKDLAIEQKAQELSFDLALDDSIKSKSRFKVFNSSHWLTKEVPQEFFNEVKAFLDDSKSPAEIEERRRQQRQRLEAIRRERDLEFQKSQQEEQRKQAEQETRDQQERINQAQEQQKKMQKEHAKKQAEEQQRVQLASEEQRRRDAEAEKREFQSTTLKQVVENEQEIERIRQKEHESKEQREQRSEQVQKNMGPNE